MIYFRVSVSDPDYIIVNGTYDVELYDDQGVLVAEIKRQSIGTINKRFEFTKDNYDMRNFYDDVMIEFNTYSQHDAINDVFLFEDSLTPMFVFAYIVKVYPKLLEYLTEYTLTKDGVELVNFMNLL